MMPTIRSGLAALVIATTSWAAVAAARSVTLTEDSGRPLVVGTPGELGSGLAPAAIAPAALVVEFQRLCLPDVAGAGGRAGTSTLALESADAVFPASGKQGEARVAQWRGPSASLSVWSGDDADLRGQPITINSRASATAGPYGPFHAKGAQCNLVVMLPDFAGALALSDAMTTVFGTPGKLVVKKTFADGYWQDVGFAPDVRINFTAPSRDAGTQPVHLSAQIREKGSK